MTEDPTLHDALGTEPANTVNGEPVGEPAGEPEYSKGTALQLAFAQRFGLVDPDRPFTPKPPVMYDDNRADRRARRTRKQTLRSWGRMMVRFQ